MYFNGLQLEYALEGNLNYIAWKDRMEAVLEDNGLKEFIDSDVSKLDSSDAAGLDAWQKKVAKTRKNYVGRCEGPYCVNPSWEIHSIFNVEGFDRSFPSRSDHRKLALKDKLKKIKIDKGNSTLKYLTKFVQCRDELGSVGIIVVDDDLMRFSLLGLLKSWHSY